MTSDKLQELRRLAEQAIEAEKQPITDWRDVGKVCAKQSYFNAAANPATILELLDEIDSERTAREQAEAQCAAMRNCKNCIKELLPPYNYQCANCFTTNMSKWEPKEYVGTEGIALLNRMKRMEDALRIACKLLAHQDCGCVCTDDVKPSGHCEKCWENRLMREALKEVQDESKV